MTLSEIYSEILLRAGEGYDAYSDRAKECFWKAVSTIIQQGQFTDTEIRNLITRYAYNISQDSFTNNRLNIMDWWGGATSSPLYQSEIFDYRLILTPIDPEHARYTEVPIAQLYQKDTLNLLNEATGIPEIIYAFDYPDLHISSRTGEFTCIATLHTHSITHDAKDNGETNADGYFNYGFLVRAMEMAAQLLKTETE
jgi:hypothetical protein